ncbi:GD15114 [Drosophila simulans]|uniref:GD15114 n=1 Tax=Drosophila simulans TaxID=7240 RepID=B4NT97_DROSI|nr:GD15114 [Drosophila simulans]
MTANLDVDTSLDMDVDVDMPATPRRVVHQKMSRGEIRLYGMENEVTNGQQGRVIDVNMSART